ncbi:MAG: polyisoprenoid-binding protein [Gemmatimonas sp.]|nr:polyisoprenoid-binding protein [Gemmatimonas sp.]
MTTNADIAGKTTWQLDPAHTLIEFSAKHMMITTVKGRLADVKGTIWVDETDPSGSRVEVEMGAASADTRVQDRDDHLRSADFLDVETYPTITFRSTRIEGAHAEAGDSFRVIGGLTIRGTTREIVVDATFEGTGKDPWGGERASFSGTTKIDRRDFGLTWNQALETGGVLVSNELRISLEVQAVKGS